MSEICSVPGCGTKLYRGNRSGVCRVHNHEKEHCGCPQCTGRRWTEKENVEPEAPLAEDVEPKREDVRSVRVPRIGIYSGVDTSANVSVPREPWSVSE